MARFAAADTAEPTEPPHPVRWLMLAGVWLLYFCFGVTSTGLAPLVAPIVRDLGISHTEMGTVLGAWQLVYIVSAVPCGTMLDRLGPRRALFVGSLLIALSGLLRSLSVDFWSLFLAVAVFGLGGPIVSAGAPKVVSLWFHGRERGLAMGIYITGPALGAIVSLSLANSVFMPFFDNDWRDVLRLWSAVAVGMGVLWMVLTLHPAAKAMERKIAAEPRVRQREVLMQLLQLPAMRIVLLMSVGAFTFNHGLHNWLPELLRSQGMSPAVAGYWASVPTAVGIAGSLLIPRFATPEHRFSILLALCGAAGLASLFLHADAGPLLLVGLVLQGIVRSSIVTVTVLTLVELPGVEQRHAGTASGLFFSAAEVGGVTGPLALGVLYDASGGFDAGLYMLTGVTILLAIAVLRLRAMSAAQAKAAD
ncbi:MAG: CynX/NimT family MFS transporter [Alphaproteobacteria bacterium]